MHLMLYYVHKLGKTTDIWNALVIFFMLKKRGNAITRGNKTERWNYMVDDEMRGEVVFSNT